MSWQKVDSFKAKVKSKRLGVVRYKIDNILKEKLNRFQYRYHFTVELDKSMLKEERFKKSVIFPIQKEIEAINLQEFTEELKQLLTSKDFEEDLYLI